MSIRDPLTRLHVTVRGRVQGVGFRWFASDTAESLGLTGWVRNLKDGSVEAEAQGTEEALKEFVERLRTGNPAARVDSIETQTRAAKNETTFRIV
ncbi:MAG: acylphosphatase [Elusimicrobia bacterium]|nr:acylphosphatase [Elusimicrobiota bacterium]